MFACVKLSLFLFYRSCPRLFARIFLLYGQFKNNMYYIYKGERSFFFYLVIQSNKQDYKPYILFDILFKVMNFLKKNSWENSAMNKINVSFLMTNLKIYLTYDEIHPLYFISLVSQIELMEDLSYRIEQAFF